MLERRTAVQSSNLGRRATKSNGLDAYFSRARHAASNCKKASVSASFSYVDMASPPRERGTDHRPQKQYIIGAGIPSNQKCAKNFIDNIASQ